jgi:hypothetical protein
LGTEGKLASEEFSVPVSIVIGELDWVQEIDLGASEKCV